MARPQFLVVRGAPWEPQSPPATAVELCCCGVNTQVVITQFHIKLNTDLIEGCLVFVEADTVLFLFKPRVAWMSPCLL